MTGREFKHLRRLSGLTQEQAAQVLQVTHRTVLRWEHGETRIRPLHADAIRSRLTKVLFGEGQAKATYLL